jgi:hypothetical protein
VFLEEASAEQVIADSVGSRRSAWHSELGEILTRDLQVEVAAWPRGHLARRTELDPIRGPTARNQGGRLSSPLVVLEPLVELLPGHGDLDGIDDIDGEDVLLPEGDLFHRVAAVRSQAE